MLTVRKIDGDTGVHSIVETVPHCTTKQIAMRALEGGHILELHLRHMFTYIALADTTPKVNTCRNARYQGRSGRGA